MIFLILLYLCFFSGPWNTLALPTDSQAPEILPTTHLPSFFIRDNSEFDTRSIYNILWSCLSTLFTCTWITVHPNIPAPGDSQSWAVIRRRLAIMAYFLLTPEFVIMWAARQYFDACYLTEKHEKNHTDWTRAHSFFLIMGGFTLHEGGKPVRVLEAEDLEELSEAGKIEWPTITKEEIADRSKGDYLSKTIVLFQTTWFVGQCIARGAYGLTVTELEVVTLAFASLTGVIYFLWWDKPLDVRCSIPIHLLDGSLGKVEGTGPQIIPFPNICAEELPESVENVIASPNPLPTTSIQVDTSTPNLVPTRMQRFRAFIRDACEEYGTLSGLGYVFISFPLTRFVEGLGGMWDCDNLGDNSLRVPTFYSPDSHRVRLRKSESPPVKVATCVAIVFGAIHCIPWSFHFPTLQERCVWRISAIFVVGVPLPWALLWPHLPTLRKKENNPIWMDLCVPFILSIFIILDFLYIFARIILLVLPFVALRALPPGAYVQLNWISFLPHI